MLVFSIPRKWPYSQQDHGLEVQAPLDPGDGTSIYCCSTFPSNQFMFIIPCCINGWALGTFWYVYGCAQWIFSFPLCPLPCPALPEGLKLAFGSLLLGLQSCWHGLYSVCLPFQNLLGDYRRQARTLLTGFMCVHVTFLFGWMPYYELPSFRCIGTFLYHDASQVILHVFSITAQGHHVSKIILYFINTFTFC
jgi:hypothetical protein